MIENSDIDLEELESLIIAESIQMEAIVSILERKGILTRDDIENEITAIQAALDSME